MTNEFKQFTNLERKLYQIIELFKANKTQKESLEKNVELFKSKIDQLSTENNQLRSQIDGCNNKQQAVREKVKLMLRNLDRLQL